MRASLIDRGARNEAREQGRTDRFLVVISGTGLYEPELEYQTPDEIYNRSWQAATFGGNFIISLVALLPGILVYAAFLYRPIVVVATIRLLFASDDYPEQNVKPKFLRL